jgi:hypothetical protein
MNRQDAKNAKKCKEKESEVIFFSPSWRSWRLGGYETLSNTLS